MTADTTPLAAAERATDAEIARVEMELTTWKQIAADNEAAYHRARRRLIEVRLKLQNLVTLMETEKYLS